MEEVEKVKEDGMLKNEMRNRRRRRNKNKWEDEKIRLNTK